MNRSAIVTRALILDDESQLRGIAKAGADAYDAAAEGVVLSAALTLVDALTRSTC